MLKNSAGYVFGLDIGTRNMVGTVGYKTKDDRFIVVAQVTKEHKTRAMLDGQIHDIAKVSESIREIKEELEKSVAMPLNEVCIAAAGRVLKTIRKKVDYEFGQETVVNDEHVYSLDMLGVEKAYEQIREETMSDSSQYYCVGYSVVQYYLNDYAISVLNDHKAMKIGVELIATFLPDEVVDGLYAAVEKASLKVSNLTLEPIAAINVAIPEKYRLLNIALVDVGAGTSDISIAKGGSIQAFGMMPYAGDEITEVIASKYLVDFATAEKIKKQAGKKEIKFKDIMGLKQTITHAELKEAVEDTVDFITRQVADKIIELNGDKTVSAVFVVGGGGKIEGFTQKLASCLGIADERVALRGQEVMANIEFENTNIKKDSLLVTPIGICLNYYEQKNNFIPVLINGEHIKLYDNDKVCVVDAALQLGLANDYLFPKRGEELVFTVNGEKRMVRGKQGEAAVIKVNGRDANLNTPIESNDRIDITESTAGDNGYCEVRELPEYLGTITFIINGKGITCPRFAHVNGEMVPGTYKIRSGDEVEILNYYTLKQALEFMDLPYYRGIKVNNELADEKTVVYENFKIEYNEGDILSEALYYDDEDLTLDDETYEQDSKDLKYTENVAHSSEKDLENSKPDLVKTEEKGKRIFVIVNGQAVALSGKDSYIFVDILDFYPFDTSVMGGRDLIMTVNDERAEFSTPVNEGDIIEMYWEK